MIGRAIAKLEAPPRRWVQHVFGVPSIHYRQKWRIVWPELERLPDRDIRLLDAGCGKGAWALEIAARRPRWKVLGLDRDPASLSIAEGRRRRLNLKNVEFLEFDFLNYEPEWRLDVILAIASAHYVVQAGYGDELFRRFHRWLAPDGMLLMFGPRIGHEVPVAPFLAPPVRKRVYSSDQLRQLCATGGLEIEVLKPCIGVLGTTAKQIAITTGHSPLLAVASYPLQAAFDGLERIATAAGVSPRSRSSFWLLRARNGPHTNDDMHPPAASVAGYSPSSLPLNLTEEEDTL
jgi:SAM-dependent methyltransferase